MEGSFCQGPGGAALSSVLLSAGQDPGERRTDLRLEVAAMNGGCSLGWGPGLGPGLGSSVCPGGPVSHRTRPPLAKAAATVEGTDWGDREVRTQMGVREKERGDPSRLGRLRSSLLIVLIKGCRQKTATWAHPEDIQSGAEAGQAAMAPWGPAPMVSVLAGCPRGLRQLRQPWWPRGPAARRN